MPGKRVNKKEKAYMQVMSDMGNSPTSIAKSMGRDHHTIIKHLQAGCNDPEVFKMAELIKQSELAELRTINWKSRSILNEYLNSILEGEREINNPIPLVAIMDRSFTQIQLLAGKSTSNVDIHVHTDNAKELQEEIKRLEKILGNE